MEQRDVFGFQGDMFKGTIIYVVKHKITNVYIAAFSSRELAVNHKQNILAYREDELFIQTTILDYYAH